MTVEVYLEVLNHIYHRVTAMFNILIKTDMAANIFLKMREITLIVISNRLVQASTREAATR